MITTSTIHNELVEIPAGSIKMRDDRTKQEWTVEIKKFMLARFPVTQALYREVMNQCPSAFQGDNKPVETVTWKDAVEFCNSLSLLTGLTPCYSFASGNGEVTFDQKQTGFRLPTEAEWQYACQAGSPNIRYGELKEIAWYKENSKKNGTQEVGKKKPNNWGLFDMLGNVWEWCSDIYDEDIYGSYRIFRGGGWCDEERSVMATTRRRSHPLSFKIDDLGLRIARTKSSIPENSGILLHRTGDY